jgi:hypothetical protein
MIAPHELASELLTTGAELWSSVECDVRKDRVVVYARLNVSQSANVQRALVASEELLKAVLAHRCNEQNWLAAVQWTERLCRTIGPSIPAVEGSPMRG